jgi:hypothetical protein
VRGFAWYGGPKPTSSGGFVTSVGLNSPAHRKHQLAIDPRRPPPRPRRPRCPPAPSSWSPRWTAGREGPRSRSAARARAGSGCRARLGNSGRGLGHSGLGHSRLGARCTILELGARSSALAFRRASVLGPRPSRLGARSSVPAARELGKWRAAWADGLQLCQDEPRDPRLAHPPSCETRAPSSSIVDRAPRTEHRDSPEGERRGPSTELEYRAPSPEPRVSEPPATPPQSRTCRAAGSR